VSGEAGRDATRAAEREAVTSQADRDTIALEAAAYREETADEPLG
jgi:hypothetical protein